MATLTKIFLKDAAKYVELSDAKEELEKYLNTIRFAKNNPEGVEDIVLSVNRATGFEPCCDDEHCDEIWLDCIKEDLFKFLGRALMDRIAEIETEKMAMLDECEVEG